MMLDTRYETKGISNFKSIIILLYLMEKELYAE
jgi:hypothetical protein